MACPDASLDTVVGGVAIPAGDLVFLHFAAAGHDPDRFPDAGELRPTREDLQHLSFGRGAHFCLGVALARLETRIALQQLATLRPGLRLVSEPEHVPRFVFRALRELVVE